LIGGLAILQRDAESHVLYLLMSQTPKCGLMAIGVVTIARWKLDTKLENQREELRNDYHSVDSDGRAGNLRGIGMLDFGWNTCAVALDHCQSLAVCLLLTKSTAPTCTR
jgi:hypothetical protein